MALFLTPDEFAAQQSQMRAAYPELADTPPDVVVGIDQLRRERGDDPTSVGMAVDRSLQTAALRYPEVPEPTPDAPDSAPNVGSADDYLNAPATFQDAVEPVVRQNVNDVLGRACALAAPEATDPAPDTASNVYSGPENLPQLEVPAPGVHDGYTPPQYIPPPGPSSSADEMAQGQQEAAALRAGTETLQQPSIAPLQASDPELAQQLEQPSVGGYARELGNLAGRAAYQGGLNTVQGLGALGDPLGLAGVPSNTELIKRATGVDITEPGLASIANSIRPGAYGLAPLHPAMAAITGGIGELHRVLPQHLDPLVQGLVDQGLFALAAVATSHLPVSALGDMANALRGEADTRTGAAAEALHTVAGELQTRLEQHDANVQTVDALRNAGMSDEDIIQAMRGPQISGGADVPENAPPEPLIPPADVITSPPVQGALAGMGVEPVATGRPENQPSEQQGALFDTTGYQLPPPAPEGQQALPLDATAPRSDSPALAEGGAQPIAGGAFDTVPEGTQIPIQQIARSDINVRPDLFQYRDAVTGQSGVDLGKVASIAQDFDPLKYGTLSVVNDPENPGQYILTSGHHRLAAADAVGLDTVPAVVDPRDISDPAQLAIAQREAALSNYHEAPTTLAEDYRAAQFLRDEQGMTPDDIAAAMRKLTATQVQRVLDIGDVGPQLLERAMLDPQYAAVASRIGAGVRQYGIDPQAANALMLRWTSNGRTSIPTLGAIDSTLSQMGEAIRQNALDRAQGGFEALGGQEWAANPWLDRADQIGELAELKTQLGREAQRAVARARAVTELGAMEGAPDTSALQEFGQQQIARLTTRIADLEQQNAARVGELAQESQQRVDDAAQVFTQSGPDLFGNAGLDIHPETAGNVPNPDLVMSDSVLPQALASGVPVDVAVTNGPEAQAFVDALAQAGYDVTVEGEGADAIHATTPAELESATPLGSAQGQPEAAGLGALADAAQRAGEGSGQATEGAGALAGSPAAAGAESAAGPALGEPAPATGPAAATGPAVSGSLNDRGYQPGGPYATFGERAEPAQPDATLNAPQPSGAGGAGRGGRPPASSGPLPPPEPDEHAPDGSAERNAEVMAARTGDQVAPLQRQVLSFARTMVAQDKPGTMLRLALKVPILRNALQAERPGLTIPDDILEANVARPRATAMVINAAIAADPGLEKAVDAAFGTGAWAGAKLPDVTYTGEHPELSVVRTLKDIADRPSQYNLTPDQQAVFDRLQARADVARSMAVDGFGADLGSRGREQGAASLGNVDQSEAALARFGGDVNAAAQSGGARGSIHESAYDRMLVDDSFQPVTDIGLLLSRNDHTAARSAGTAVFDAGVGGITRPEAVALTNPGIAGAMTNLRTALAGLRSSGGNLDRRLEDAITTFTRSPQDTADLQNLAADLPLNVDALNPEIGRGPNAGMDRADIAARIASVREQIQALNPAYKAANLGNWTLVQDGLYRYFPREQAQQLGDLLRQTDPYTDAAAKAAGWVTGTAFTGHMAPRLTLGFLFNGRTAAASMKFGSDEIAQMLAEDPDLGQRYAQATGHSVRVTPGEEFASGAFKDVGILQRFNQATYNATTAFGLNLFRNLSDINMQHGATQEEADAAAGAIVTEVIPQLDRSRLGQSAPGGRMAQALETSPSFVRQAPSLVKEALDGAAKYASGMINENLMGPVTPRERLAFHEMTQFASTVAALSLSTAVAQALSNHHENPERALEEVKLAAESVLPGGSRFMKMSVPFTNLSFAVGGAYRRVLQAFLPGRVQVAGMKQPLYLPFAGMANYVSGSANPAVSLALQEHANKDFYGNPIRTLDFPLNIAQGAVHIGAGILPLFAQVVAQAALDQLPPGFKAPSGYTLEEYVGELMGRFFATSVSEDSPYAQRDQAVREWAAGAGVQGHPQSFFDLQPADKQAFTKANPDIAKQMQQQDTLRAGQGNQAAALRQAAGLNTQTRLDQEQALAGRVAAGEAGKGIRDTYNQIQRDAAQRSAGIDTAYQAYLASHQQQRPSDPNQQALFDYYDAFRGSVDPDGNLNGDVLDQRLAQFNGPVAAGGWTDTQKAYVQTNAGIAQHDPGLSDFLDTRKTLNDLGYYNIASSAWKDLANQAKPFAESSPQTAAILQQMAPFPSYYAWRDAMVGQAKRDLIARGVQPGIADQQASAAVSSSTIAQAFSKVETAWRQQFIATYPKASDQAAKYGYLQLTKPEEAYIQTKLGNAPQPAAVR